jgi:hypothetical protein
MNITPRYSENPLYNERIVETFNGEKEYRSHCKFINQKFYIKNKQCFLIGGKWHRIDSGLILLDYEKGIWFKETEKGVNGTVYGIVDVDNYGNFIYGYFTPNPLNNCVLVMNSSSKIPVLNPNILYDNNCIEDVSRGIFYPKKDLTLTSIKQLSIPRNKISHTHKGYNIEDNGDEFQKKIEIYSNYKMPMSKDVMRFGKFLEDTSFGVELETIKGYLPEFVQYRTGVVVCRDGSLHDADGTQGAEFVTVPMTGAKGLQNLVNLCTELSKRTEIDINCSLHIHLGNIPTDRLFLTSLYMLCFKIQNELFEMFPYYKTNPQGIKQKNYNQKLRKLGMYALNNFTREGYDEYVNSAYNRIFTFLTEGTQPSKKFNRQNKLHPAGEQKWNKHSRYFWVNFINIIFSQRNTIEFRPHHGTLNSQKVINWLFIVNAIVKYASLNSKNIITTGKKISLSQVLSYYADYFKTPKAVFLSEYLKGYVEDRKKLFKADLANGDKLSQHEITNDLKYVYNFNGITNLF